MSVIFIKPFRTPLALVIIIVKQMICFTTYYFYFRDIIFKNNKTIDLKLKKIVKFGQFKK